MISFIQSIRERMVNEKTILKLLNASEDSAIHNLKWIIEAYEKNKKPSWPQIADLLNTQDKNGNTFLHKFGDTDLVDFLLQKGADANILNKFGKKPLDHNISTLSVDQAASLIKATKDINNVSFEWGNPRLSCVLRNDYGDNIFLFNKKAQIVEHLINAGADVNKPDNHGNSPVGYALKQFLIHPFNDFNNLSPKLTASTVDMILCAMKLIQNGAVFTESESKLAKKNLTPFSRYIIKNVPFSKSTISYAMLSLFALPKTEKLSPDFLKAGCYLSSYKKVVDNYSKKGSLLDNFEEIYYKKIISLSENIDEAVDQSGKTAFQMALEQKNTSFALLLAKAGADLTKTNALNQTSLHEAALLGDEKLCSFILQQGVVDVNTQDANGNTALLLATNEHIIEALLEYKANPYIQNNKGENLFDYMDNIHVALLLEEHHKKQPHMVAHQKPVQKSKTQTQNIR